MEAIQDVVVVALTLAKLPNVKNWLKEEYEPV